MELTNEDVMRVFDAGDSDQDGQIDYTDFAAIIEKGMEEYAAGDPSAVRMGGHVELSETPQSVSVGSSFDQTEAAAEAPPPPGAEERTVGGVAEGRELPEEPTADAELYRKIGDLVRAHRAALHSCRSAADLRPPSRRAPRCDSRWSCGRRTRCSS
jgi:hypothetical protein